MIMALGMSGGFSVCFIFMALSFKLMTIFVNISLEENKSSRKFKLHLHEQVTNVLPYIRPTGPLPPTHCPPLAECLLNSQVWGAKTERQGGICDHRLHKIVTSDPLYSQSADTYF